IESDLPSGEPAMAVDCSMGRAEDLDWPAPWIEGEGAFPLSPGIDAVNVCEGWVSSPFPQGVAAMNADVQTGPVDGLHRLNGYRGCFARKIGRHCGRRQRAKSKCKPRGAHVYLQ